MRWGWRKSIDSLLAYPYIDLAFDWGFLNGIKILVQWDLEGKFLIINRLIPWFTSFPGSKFLFYSLHL